MKWVRSLVTREASNHSQLYHKVCGFFWWNVLKLTAFMVAHICEYSKKHLIVYNTIQLCGMWIISQSVKKYTGIEINSVVDNTWLCECRLNKKGNSFDMEIFQIVLMVLVMILHKCVKTSEPIYYKRIHFTTCKLCLNKNDFKKWR